MKLYGQAESCANKILAAFQSGNLPQALAPVFIKRNDDQPCRQWSWSNQLLTALSGFDDARGFRQWLDAGRAVRKGQKSFQILAPIVKNEAVKEAKTGEERKRSRILGFRTIPVFGREQTDIVDESAWAEHSRLDESAERFIAELPLIDVARAWGLTIKSYSGTGGKAQGWYRRGQAIALGVENQSTWAHELIHAADDRLGNLTERGQHWMSETVAELGGAVLLMASGYQTEADLGGAWLYICNYAKTAEVEPVRACMKALDRVCKAVALVLTTADELTGIQAAKAVA